MNTADKDNLTAWMTRDTEVSTEIIPDPVPAVDAELEEAKKLVGGWVVSDYNSVAFVVQEVEREDDDDCSPIYVKGNCGFRWLLSEVEPFPLPTAANWRCMKTEAPNGHTSMDKEYVIRLQCYEYNTEDLATGYWSGAQWVVNGIAINAKDFHTALWLEIPRGE